MSRSNWSAIAAYLQHLDRQALIEALHNLYRHSSEAREILTRQALNQNPEALHKFCRQRLTAQFRPAENSFPDPAAAQEIIRAYEQQTRDQAGAMELSLMLIEQGTRFAKDYGGLDAEFYAGLESELARVVKRLSGRRQRARYFALRTRLLQLQRDVQWAGWGYEDAVREAVAQLRDAHADWPEAAVL